MAVKVDCADICDSFNTGQFCYMGDFRHIFFSTYFPLLCVSIISLSVRCFIIFYFLVFKSPFLMLFLLRVKKIIEML